MKEPLVRNNHGRAQSFGGFSQSGTNYGNNFRGSHNNSAAPRRKSDYCWNFNKGLKCKFGAKCKFIERCSYCDSGAHGIIVCPKLEGKKETPGKKTSVGKSNLVATNPTSSANSSD